MRIITKEDHIVYIPNSKINHIFFGNEYQGAVTMEISLDNIHGLHDGWNVKMPRMKAIEIIEKLERYEDVVIVEGE